MASNTFELMRLIADIYHTDWQVAPISRGWLIPMLVFCLLSVLVDVGSIGSAFAILDLLVKRKDQSGDLAASFCVVWGLTVTDWLVEAAAGLGTSISIHRRSSKAAGAAVPAAVPAAMSACVTTLAFTAVQCGTLPLAAHLSLMQLRNSSYTAVMQIDPAVRSFVYLSLIQTISYCLSTYTVVLWSRQELVRGGSLFLSVLGVPFARSVGAYSPPDKLQDNWAVLLARVLVYALLCIPLYLNASLVLSELGSDLVPGPEKATSVALFVFVIFASLPMFATYMFCFWCCCCCNCSAFCCSCVCCFAACGSQLRRLGRWRLLSTCPVPSEQWLESQSAGH